MPTLAQHSKAQHEELDRGATSVARGVERTCALTRVVKPVSDMIRFVLSPDETVVPDVKHKLPGRGLWISASRPAIEEAVRRNVFARGFKHTVKLGPNLAVETERLLERTALDALAIAAKASRVVTGFTRVEATIARGEAKALLHASDGAADGKRKLNAVLGRNGEKTSESAGEIAIVEEFSGTQLDLALNCPNVVHAALLAGPGSETFLARTRRLRRFRTGQSPEAASAGAPSESA
jgi:uncharacterized protein